MEQSVQDRLAYGKIGSTRNTTEPTQSVFLRKVDIDDEDVLWKELLLFFMNADPSLGYLKFLKGIRPLDFDPGLVGDYLDCFKSDASKAQVMDELESHYEELDPVERKERLQIMGFIGAPGIDFNDPDEGDDRKDRGDEGQRAGREHGRGQLPGLRRNRKEQPDEQAGHRIDEVEQPGDLQRVAPIGQHQPHGMNKQIDAHGDTPICSLHGTTCGRS